MQEIWNRLYNEAKRALNPRKVSDMVEAINWTPASMNKSNTRNNVPDLFSTKIDI